MPRQGRMFFWLIWRLCKQDGPQHQCCTVLPTRQAWGVWHVAALKHQLLPVSVGMLLLCLSCSCLAAFVAQLCDSHAHWCSKHTACVSAPVWCAMCCSLAHTKSTLRQLVAYGWSTGSKPPTIVPTMSTKVLALPCNAYFDHFSIVTSETSTWSLG
jgi:hypothetical protein